MLVVEGGGNLIIVSENEEKMIQEEFNIKENQGSSIDTINKTVTSSCNSKKEFLKKAGKNLKKRPGVRSVHELPLQTKGFSLPKSQEKMSKPNYSSHWQSNLLADNLLTNIANEKLKNELEEKMLELEEANSLIFSICQISSELSTVNNVKTLLKTFLLRIIECFSCSKGLILNFTDEPSTLEVFATYNINNLLPKQRINLTEGGELFANLVKTGKVQKGFSDYIFGIESKSALCIPLKSEKGMLGILCLFDRKRVGEVVPFTDKDEAITISLINQISSQWQKMKLYEMASFDPLTKLYNRRFLENSLVNEVKRARRFERPLSVMMIDIDHFKKFNDLYGHQVGDEVLKHVADQIKENIRKDIDIAARYGGEELVVIMPETNSIGATILAERIRSIIEKNNLARDLFEITVSIGIATFPAHEASGSKLIELADRALYQSKETGRNRVTVI